MNGKIIDKTNISIKDFIDFPLSVSGKGVVNDRELHLKYVLDKVNPNGLMLEFGVYNGTTINIISSTFCENQIWGFDSFEGLPEDWITTDKEIIWSKGHFAVESLPNVNSNVTLVKGWFDKTLPEWINKNRDRVSFLHIDCDLYSSTSTVLTLLNDYIVKDTIISFDELYHFGNPKKYSKWHEGEFKALTEWLEMFDRKIEIISRNRHMQCALKVVK